MTNPHTWLERHRLTNPVRTDRRSFPLPLADISRHIGAPEPEVAEALAASGYSIEDGHVNMQRFFWRMAIGPQPKDDPTHRQHIDRIAAAWARQLGQGSVVTAMLLGGELREAIAAAIDEPSAARLAKFIQHGRAVGDRYGFHLADVGPRQYAVRELHADLA